MTIGLHPRLSGRPGRTMAIKKFIDHIKPIEDVWITKRIEIAKYWLKE
jgi:allantoinase